MQSPTIESRPAAGRTFHAHEVEEWTFRPSEAIPEHGIPEGATITVRADGKVIVTEAIVVAELPSVRPLLAHLSPGTFVNPACHVCGVRRGPPLSTLIEDRRLVPAPEGLVDPDGVEDRAED